MHDLIGSKVRRVPPLKRCPRVVTPLHFHAETLMSSLLIECEYEAIV